ncbi:hypothetical protein CC85DRAFT_282507 [Cutaneotrichosporon oleaginosum]|uniref:Zinc-finger domain-containing protein n=1 Tax=Cutaneotrichosporon oleaginosum TaxID=879819 RepID=A0A0J1BBQ7_9TREE|nr:uncharacterized protein CC85DRAFT_282507 [Cutaneotrichosporon oleaginosum]KLT45429.1 hypothetical protein CC85DRAFT_282507 [Cutaneotrichosporon oleaginosum]TXT14610.1 hypothetical protein COLE_00803 [Cutaneotrichosporon oleaginosum]
MTSNASAPALTAGTTAPTSPSPESPLSPAPDPGNFTATKKRKAPASGAIQKKAKAEPKNTPKTPKCKAKANGESKEKPTEKGTYCHQCRTKIEPENVLRCTKLRKYTKSTPARACNLAWCERDLRKRYEVDPDAIKARGHNVDSSVMAKHDGEKEYVWACPCCLDECQNSTCRIKKGLQPLGDVVRLAAEQGVTPLELVAQINADGPEPTTKSRVDMFDMIDGELSDLDAPEQPVSRKTKKEPARKAAKKPTKETKKAAPKQKEKSVPKKAAKKETPKVAPRPRIVWPKCDPPEIPNIDTRMGREEVEQRMYLREFVCRFRELLKLPDRGLGALDDFDHPLGETTVRQLASAFLGLVADPGSEHYTGGYEPELDIDVENLREEMRYADLARFASIYQEASDLLGLQMPPDPTEAARRRNEKAMRTLLDLGADDEAPAWAMEAGPSSRRGASRLPAPSEVVRMLLALVEHVTHLDIVRFHMDPNVRYSASDEIRKMSAAQKEEAMRWDVEKKQLNAARVRAKSAADTRAAREKFKEREEEHHKLSRMATLNYRAGLARKAMRFEPLGTDLDGRIYYTLTAREIDRERYRPGFWARGVLIWGRGWGQEEDDIPALVERWMIVNSGEDLRALAKYIAYRWRTKHSELEAAEEEAAKAKKKTKATPKSTPRRPSLKQTASGRKAAVNGYDSDDSELSSPPDDLLELLDPPGYEPSAEILQEEQFKLESGIGEVAMLVEALEWKGIRP